MSERVLHIDFETRSTVDLRKTGSYVYAEHETTDLWCAAYAFDHGPIELWTPGQPCPAEIALHVAEGGLLFAHNAAFERVIWRYVLGPRYGWPEPTVEQWRCTMAMCFAMALPGSLENASAALALDAQKDMAGHRLMLQMARPRRIDPDGTIVWWDDEDRKQRLFDYCKTDVETERQVHRRVVALRPFEQRLWQLDQTINDRGVGVDEALCLKATSVVRQTTEKLNARMKETTGGAVGACSNTNELTVWLRAQGVDTNSVAKDVLADLLARDDLSPAARIALNLRREAAKTSTAKINTLLTGMNADGRARGLLQYHGAATGRWAGRRFQPQNIARPDLKDVDGAIEALMTGNAGYVHALYGSPLHAVSNCLRGMLAAPKGRKLLASDFANIEGRVLAWLAGQVDKIRAFELYDAGEGPDLYLVTAAGILGVSIEDARPHRQSLGKVSELSLGFQGGPGAYAMMAVTYGVKIADHFDVVWAAAGENREAAEKGWESRGKTSGMSKKGWLAAEAIKLAWRRKNDRITAFWPRIEEAAIEAVAEPGKVTHCGPLAFRKVGSFLWCRLPSGRSLCYCYPKLIRKKMPWTDRDGNPVYKPALAYKGVNSYTRKWEEIDTYGGKLTENVVQAIARDVLAEAMVRLEERGYETVLTVHDEVVAEADEGFGSLDEFNEIMAVLPDWAEGLPVAVEGWEGRRYRK